MTTHLVDLASYQQGINLAKVKAAGFTAVNVKLSQGNSYTWSQAGTYLGMARDLGMGICVFHWLDNSASGAVQARIVQALMRRYGGPAGMAHQVDCEDSTRPATWAIWRDYVTAMQDYLGRHVINYTGDWWWQPRGWNGAALTPYLWAAPNNGYLPSYPGDGSSQWRAGYGGWGDYAALQYNVGPIAGAGTGAGDVSKTAFRDPAVWAALTGGINDVNLSDPVPGTSSPNHAGDRNVSDVLHDAAEMRAVLWGDLPLTAYPANSPLVKLVTGQSAPVSVDAAAVAAALTVEQLAAIGTAMAVELATRLKS